MSVNSKVRLVVGPGTQICGTARCRVVQKMFMFLYPWVLEIQSLIHPSSIVLVIGNGLEKGNAMISLFSERSVSAPCLIPSDWFANSKHSDRNTLYKYDKLSDTASNKSKNLFKMQFKLACYVIIKHLF